MKSIRIQAHDFAPIGIYPGSETKAIDGDDPQMERKAVYIQKSSANGRSSLFLYSPSPEVIGP